MGRGRKPNKSPAKSSQKTHQETPQNTPQKTPDRTPQKSPHPAPKGPPHTLKAVSDSLTLLENILKPLLDGTTEHSDVNNVLTVLTQAVKDISKHLYSEDKKKVEVEVKMRERDDEIDAQKQINLKGKFVITSPPGGDPMVKSAEEFKDEKNNIIDHVIDLAHKKYKVTVPKEEISSCYHLKKGGIVLSFWNLGRGSAFQKIVTNIKKNDVNKEYNVFFNFMLTRRRSNLLYEVRQHKKDKDISKFFTDENGNISIQMENEAKERITYFYEKSTKAMRTLTIEELKAKM